MKKIKRRQKQRMTNGMKIAVLLATYNGEKYIEEQVNSIFKQLKVSCDIYISDDGSTDDTLSIINNYRDPRIKVLINKSRYGSAGRNFINAIVKIDYAGYDFVAFCDQDDIWYEDKLIRSISAIKRHGVDAYSSNILAFWPSGKKRVINKAQKQKKHDYLFEAAGPGCTYVIRSEIMQDIRGFLARNKSVIDQIWMHDWFVYAYVRSRGLKWFIDNEPTMLYRQHEHNQVGVNEGLRAMAARLKFVRSGEYARQIRFLKELVGSSECSYLNESIGLFKRVRFLLDVCACRRRTRDQIALALMIAMGWFK